MTPLKVTYHVALSVPKGTEAAHAAVVSLKAMDARGNPLAEVTAMLVLAHLDFCEEAS